MATKIQKLLKLEDELEEASKVLADAEDVYDELLQRIADLQSLKDDGEK